MSTSFEEHLKGLRSASLEAKEGFTSLLKAVRPLLKHSARFLSAFQRIDQSVQFTINNFRLSSDFYCLFLAEQLPAFKYLRQRQNFKKRSFCNIKELNKLLLVLPSFPFRNVLSYAGCCCLHLANKPNWPGWGTLLPNCITLMNPSFLRMLSRNSASNPGQSSTTSKNLLTSGF